MNESGVMVFEETDYASIFSEKISRTGQRLGIRIQRICRATGIQTGYGAVFSETGW